MVAVGMVVLEMRLYSTSRNPRANRSTSIVVGCKSGALASENICVAIGAQPGSRLNLIGTDVGGGKKSS